MLCIIERWATSGSSSLAISPLADLNFVLTTLAEVKSRRLLPDEQHIDVMEVHRISGYPKS